MANSSQLTLDPDAQLLLKLREVLLDAGYCEAGLAPTINDEPMNLPDPSAEAGAEPRGCKRGAGPRPPHETLGREPCRRPVRRVERGRCEARVEADVDPGAWVAQ